MPSPLRFNPGESPLVYDSGTAYGASGVISSTGPALLYGFSGYNSKVSSQFIMIYDSATVPADGAGAKIILFVAATASFSWDPGKKPRAFVNGISWSNSSTAPTKTVGAADTFLTAQFDN